MNSLVVSFFLPAGRWFTCGHTHKYSSQKPDISDFCFSRRHVAPGFFSPAKRYRLFELFFSTHSGWWLGHCAPSSKSTLHRCSGIEQKIMDLFDISSAFHHLFTIAQMFSPPLSSSTVVIHYAFHKSYSLVFIQ